MIAEYFKNNLNRLDDKSLAHLLRMQVMQSKGLPEDFISPNLLRKHVLRVLSQENFETKNYTIILKTTFDLMSRPEFNKDVVRKELPVREDLDFWVKVCMYIPRLEFETQD